MPMTNSMNKIHQYFEACGITSSLVLGIPIWNVLLRFSDESQEDGNRQREHMAHRCPHLNVRNFRVQQ